MMQIALAGTYAHLHALVDDEDFEDAVRFSWVYTKIASTIYARRNFFIEGRKHTEYLHRRLTTWARVDHINGDGLDNRCANLREATASQNNRNVGKRSQYRGGPTLSVYKGVSSARKGSKPWVAHIRAGKQIHLGCFASEVEAALVYDQAALRYHGEFAQLNFPEGR